MTTTLEALFEKWEFEATYPAIAANEWQRGERETLTRVAAELRAALAVGGWQTMESAPPPRGKNLLLWAATDVAEDGTIRNWKMATGFLCYSTGELIWEGSRLKPYEVQPTHWRHTPEPPR